MSSHWTALMAFLLVMPAPASAQDGAYEVVGLMRASGVVFPELAYTDGRWTPVPMTTVGEWEGIKTYHYRDSVGVRLTLSAGEPRAACCDGQANDRWGHPTDFPDPGRASDWSPILGYVVSNPAAEAPFIESEREVDAEQLRTMLDPLAPFPDSMGTTVTVWNAELEGIGFTFFQAIRHGRQPAMGQACYVSVGWVGPGGTELTLASSGLDDCTGKGHGTLRPYAILKRGGALFMFLSRHLYGDTEHEIWRQVGPMHWEVEVTAHR